MLKIDESYVKRLRVPKGTPNPAPFAGRYPTRIYAEWVDFRVKPIMHVESYIGKPSEQIARRFLLEKPYRFFKFVEFDRKYKLISTAIDKPPILNAHLFSIYHPGVDPVQPLASFLLKHFWLDGLPFSQRTKDGKFVYYLAPAQRPGLLAMDAKVKALLEGLTAEQLAQREAARELLRKKKAAYAERMGYKQYGSTF